MRTGRNRERGASTALTRPQARYRKGTLMDYVILGAGPAGVTAAETIRSLDSKAGISVISAEPYPPYSPPGLADHFLTGSGSHLWKGTDWPEQWGIDYVKGARALAVMPHDRLVVLEGKRTLPYGRLIIATGSRLHAPVEGSDLPGVSNFKSLTAAEQILKKVKKGSAKTAVIVGAGFIGLEIATLLRSMGLEVTIVEMLDQVMPFMLGRSTAQVVLEALAGQGIDVRLETKAEAFTGKNRAKGVLLGSGEELAGDILVAATGVQPNLEFLEGSGIKCNEGILVDDRLCTNHPEIYAAGDVTQSFDIVMRKPVMNAIFPKAVEQGTAAGINAAGGDVLYEGSVRMNSLKHLDLPVIAAGLKEGEEILKDRSNGCLRTCYLKGNKLVGYQLAGDVRTAGILHSLMTRQTDISPIKDRLLETNFGQGFVAGATLEQVRPERQRKAEP